MATTLKLNTFSLYLAKKEVAAFDELLTEKALELIASGEGKISNSSKFGDGAALYTFPGDKNVPKWVPLVRGSFTVPPIFSQSPCAVLAFKMGKQFFALTFSYGHVYLNDSKTEADFGLKAAINAISDEKLRSVERSNLGAAIRGFAQAAGQIDLRAFGFNDALDLIRKVSGRAEESDFANMVTGSHALRFSKRIEAEDVPDVALEAVTLFRSTAYQDTAFRVIDFLAPVLDPVVQAHLDDEVTAIIRSGTDDFEIAIPEILPDSIGTFRFEHAGFSDFHSDLSLEFYRESLGAKLKTLTVAELKHHQVTAYGDSETKPIDKWPVIQALVGSLVWKGERYAISEGHWYRINKLFKDGADRRFQELLGPPDLKLLPLKKIYPATKKGQKKKEAYQTEESYNKEMAKVTGYLLMDQQLIQIPEVAGAMEACDLLDIPGRRFIHVKKSSRQSSVLSHFFKQGNNAAQMIRSYEAFKAALIAKVEALYGTKKAAELKSALKDKWTVNFQIADFPRKNGKFAIPFFSRLSLRDEARNIEAMDFNVTVSFIKLTRIKK